MRENWALTSRSLLLSIIFHLGLGILLVFSSEFSPSPTPPPKPVVNIINAVAVDKKQVELEIKRIKDKEIKRQEDIKKKEKEKKKKIQKEKNRLKEIKKKKEREKKKRAEEKLRIKKLEKEKLEKEKKNKAEQKKREEEKKKKVELEKKKKGMQQALQDELEAELEAERDAKQQQLDLTIIQRYQFMITRTIESKFNRLGLEKGLTCVILIRMIEGGKVVDTSLIQSSGNELFDQRAKKAVYVASPLPVPDEARIFNKMRTIEFTFRPKN